MICVGEADHLGRACPALGLPDCPSHLYDSSSCCQSESLSKGRDRWRMRGNHIYRGPVCRVHVVLHAQHQGGGSISLAMWEQCALSPEPNANSAPSWSSQLLSAAAAWTRLGSPSVPAKRRRMKPVTRTVMAIFGPITLCNDHEMSFCKSWSISRHISCSCRGQTFTCSSFCF